ncbi:hypothetical protein AAKU61_003841 [Undibacterium sp. GrIS 1.2]
MSIACVRREYYVQLPAQLGINDEAVDPGSYTLGSSRKHSDRFRKPLLKRKTMFIFWGRKAVFTKLGHVADFCSICRDQRSFLIQRVGSVGHLYYISFGEGELVGYQRTCQVCKTKSQTEPTKYASISKDDLPLDELTQKTYPNLEEVFRERTKLEERIRNAPHLLTKEERHAQIRQAFIQLSPKVEKRFSATHIDKEIALSIFGALALLVLGPSIMHSVLPDEDGIVLVTFVILGISLITWQIALAGGRFMERKIIPALAANLAPLQPKQSEIQSVADELKHMRHKIGSKINVEILIGAVSKFKTSA